MTRLCDLTDMLYDSVRDVLTEFHDGFMAGRFTSYSSFIVSMNEAIKDIREPFDLMFTPHKVRGLYNRIFVHYIGPKHNMPDRLYKILGDTGEYVGMLWIKGFISQKDREIFISQSIESKSISAENQEGYTESEAIPLRELLHILSTEERRPLIEKLVLNMM